jgi:hypothetical protein
MLVVLLLLCGGIYLIHLGRQIQQIDRKPPGRVDEPTVAFRISRN